MYDTSLFIDIIESTNGITFIRLMEKNGVHTRIYQGLNGKMVWIDTTDEEMPIIVAKQYLGQLGLAELIPLIFTAEVISKLS